MSERLFLSKQPLLGSLWPEDQPFAWVIFFAILFYLVYALYRLFAPSVAFIEDKISLLYLPAFVRVLAVIVAGLAGAIGIFLGHLLVYAVYKSDPWTFALGASAVNALAPLCALIVTRMFFQARHLISLGWRSILTVSLLAALFAGIFKNIFWAMSEFREIASFSHMAANFVGNFLGMAVGFLLFKWAQSALPFRVELKRKIL